MDLHGKQIINGQATAESSKTFRATNPASGAAIVGEFHEATAGEVDAACDLAGRVFDQVRARSAKDRAALLRAIAGQIMNLGDALVGRAVEETGLPKGRIEGERGRTCNQLKLFADLIEEGSWVDARIDRSQPDRQPMPKPDC